MLIRGYRLVIIALLPNRCRIGTHLGRAVGNCANCLAQSDRWSRPVGQRSAAPPALPTYVRLASSRRPRGLMQEAALAAPRAPPQPSRSRAKLAAPSALRAPTRPPAGVLPILRAQAVGCALTPEVGSCICRKTHPCIACERRARLAKTASKSFAPWPADR